MHFNRGCTHPSVIFLIFFLVLGVTLPFVTSITHVQVLGVLGRCGEGDFMIT